MIRKNRLENNRSEKNRYEKNRNEMDRTRNNGIEADKRGIFRIPVVFLWILIAGMVMTSVSGTVPAAGDPEEFFETFEETELSPEELEEWEEIEALEEELESAEELEPSEEIDWPEGLGDGLLSEEDLWGPKETTEDGLSDEELQELIDWLAEEGDVDGINEAELEQQEEKDHGVSGDDNSMFIAHTGMAGKAPQNSTAAFDLAGQNGYWGIETDLRWSKDHVLVCYHDESLEKHSNGTGSVSSRNWSYLKNIYVSAGNTKTYGSLPIATFEEYLDICKSYGCNAIIDVKSCANGYKQMLKAAYDMIVEKDMLGQVVFQCSLEKYLDYIRDMDSKLRIWLLVGQKGAWDGAKIRRAYTRWNCEAVNAPVADTSIARAIHSYGMLYAFYQTDNSKLQRQYFGKGVDLIMENGK